jgi:hypothetical protein
VGVPNADTATSLNNLGMFYEHQGRYQEAEPFLKRAVMIVHASFGTEHPHTQQILQNYLTLLADLHTNGDIEALIHLLAQKQQNDSQEEELRQNT